MDPQADPHTPPPNDNGTPAANDDGDAAAAFARAKISAIFQEPTPLPAPGSEVAPEATQSTEPAPQASANPPVPAPIYPEAAPAPTAPMTQPEQFYQQETALQNEIQPGLPHVAPDHQLPPAAELTPNTTFQTLHLPGQTANPTVSQVVAEVGVPGALAEVIPSLPTIEQPIVMAPPSPAGPVGASIPPSRSEQIKQFAASSASKLKAVKQKGHILRPLIKSALVTAVVFLFYNAPIVLGQVHYYITPANSEPTPIILDESSAGVVGPEPKIIISKLNIDVPAVYDETSFDEHLIQAALQRGIVHYGTTALPGELGNAVFMGHSSNSPWAPGKFKTAFSLLRRLEVSDTFVMHYQSQRYIYEVFDKRITNPSDFSVIEQNVSEPIVTLITCDPPGANWNRMIIQARQISPDPTKASTPATAGVVPDSGALPGSPPSLFDRIKDWLF